MGMQVIRDMVQGSGGWKSHRRTKRNASDAPKVTGDSSYGNRESVMAFLKFGVEPEFPEQAQKRMNDGHAFEALARPLAEKIAGVTLSSITAVNGEYGASYDGIDFDYETAFEHKTLNAKLRKAMTEDCTGIELPMEYQVQMEHQCLVCPSIKKVLFMASVWDLDTGELIEERHCWYTPSLELRSHIVSCWDQLAEDMKSYTLPEPKPEAVAEEVTDLPAISMVAKGEVAIVDNLEVFEKGLTVFLQKSLVKDPKTDNDFATLNLQIKVLEKAEAALKTAGDSVLAQVEAVDAAMKKKDSLAELVRQNRLASEKLLQAKKDQIKRDIVINAEESINAHILTLEDEFSELTGCPLRIWVDRDVPGAIKGKRTLATLQSSANDEVARAKIAANQMADRIRVNIEYFDSVINDIPKTIFGDLSSLLPKGAADFAAAVTLRIHEYEKQIEEQAERKRQQDEAEAKRKAEAQAAVDQVTQAHEDEYHETQANPLADIPVKSGTQVKAETTIQTLAGDLCRYCRDKGLTPADAQELMALVEKYTNLDAKAA
jgi:predicted phage-related endonuclease